MGKKNIFKSLEIEIQFSFKGNKTKAKLALGDIEILEASGGHGSAAVL
jgi:hypothetical protein